MTPFFVTGLPRSRTAWLANWLTTEKTLCFHDVRYSKDLLRHGRRVGFSGPELMDQANDILDEQPQWPWLLVVRDPQESLRAFVNWAGDMLPKQSFGAVESVWRRRTEEMVRLAGRPAVMAVRYADLGSAEWAKSSWDHLLPGIPFDFERWEILNRLQVEQRKENN